MYIFKNIILCIIFIISTSIGILISKKYANRVIELKEIRNSLSIIKNKIKFTYEPLNEIFQDISSNTNNVTNTIENVFKMANDALKSKNINDAWEYAVENSNTNLKQEDIKIIKEFGKLLGQTDIEGQVSQIELTESFIEIQIKKAEEEKEKNEKLYKTLGTVIGLAIIIILI